MAPKKATSSEHKLVLEPPNVLDGTVLPDEKPFNLEEELKKMGGVETLIPGPGADSIIRQRLSPALEKAFQGAANVHLSAMYTFLAMADFCDKDKVSLPGHSKLFFKRALRDLRAFRLIASFTSSRGGDLKLQDILAPPQTFNSEHGGMAVAVMEFSLATLKVVYEKQLQLFKAAEMAGDGGAMHFVNEKLVRPMVEVIKTDAMYITMLRNVGAGVGEYTFDHHLLLGVDPGELTSGQIPDKIVEKMFRPEVPPTKRLFSASEGIMGLLNL